MEKLRNRVMAYDWGSRSAIAQLTGRPAPAAGPEAEMWIGAHASAPSAIDGEPGAGTLDRRIADAPEETLGADVRRRFGDRLPFLLKILAAEVPLSLQAHPSLAQARAGHAREEALGIALDARDRCYKDTNHKPEILCALGPFEALCGFRRAGESLALLERLAVPSLATVVDSLRTNPGPRGVREAFELLLRSEPPAAAALVREVVEACRREIARGDARPAAGDLQPAAGDIERDRLEWTIALAALHPCDAGVVASLLLNHVRLEAGEALFLPAGNLHSYLRGTGIELMASSDNVLRGGLTTKHVDVEELLTVLDFRDGPWLPAPVRRVGEHEEAYVTATPDFRLSVVELRRGQACRPDRRGPELLLCVRGLARVTAGAAPALELRGGDSVFVPACDGPYEVTGEATLYRAVVGDEPVAAQPGRD